MPWKELLYTVVWTLHIYFSCLFMVPARTDATDALRVTVGPGADFLDRCNACKHCGYGVLLFFALRWKVRVSCVDLESN